MKTRYGSSEIQPEQVLNVQLEYTSVAMDFIEDGTGIVFGDLEGRMLALDLMTMEASYLGQHKHGVNRVHYYPKHSLTLSLGEDSVMQLYDARSPEPVFSEQLQNGIPVSSDLKKETLIIATN